MHPMVKLCHARLRLMARRRKRARRHGDSAYLLERWSLWPLLFIDAWWLRLYCWLLNSERYGFSPAMWESFVPHRGWKWIGFFSALSNFWQEFSVLSMRTVGMRFLFCSICSGFVFDFPISFFYFFQICRPRCVIIYTPVLFSYLGSRMGRRCMELWEGGGGGNNEYPAGKWHVTC